MAAYHPQFVHFAIALLVVGMVFRALSLIGRPAFLNASAFTLLTLGTIAAVLAANSGTAAHGPVERVPGSRSAVEEHEEWGNRTRTAFVGVLAIEVLGLLFTRSPKRRYLQTASTLVGVIGLGCLYQAGEYGGRLVYSYAGGVGIRTGDPEDVGRLLLAGLYQQAQLDRRNGRADGAAELLAQAARRFPTDPEVQLAAAESLLIDRKDAQGALTSLRAIAPPPAANRPLRIRHGLLTADALEAAGQRDGAAAVVQALVTDFPDVARLKQRLNALKAAPPPQ
jgi:uncharacterized membrane protein